jgi:hypothetical protein
MGTLYQQLIHEIQKQQSNQKNVINIFVPGKNRYY